MVNKQRVIQQGIFMLLLGVCVLMSINGKGCASSNSTKVTNTGSSGDSNTSIIYAPYNLVAVSNSPTQITLNWTDDSANEDGFYIERKTGAGGIYAQIASVSQNIISYNDDSVSPETTYYYRIMAYNSQTNSSYSNGANATTGSLPPAPPAVINDPSDLGATAVSSTRIALGWTDNSDNEDGFSIERKTGAGGSFASITSVSQDVASYNDNSVSPNTTYYYRVEAYNSLTTSNYSNEANATTPISVTINAPSNLIASAISPTRVALNWTDNSDNENGFSIERKTGSGGSYASITSVGQDVASYNDNSVSSETTYYYRIQAYNVDDNSNYSNEANATTQILGNWTKIFTGYRQSFGCRNNNTLWAWGDNWAGQLGLGDSDSKRNTPTKVGTTSDWAVAATSMTHSLAIKIDGSIWGTGNNENGELGLGTTISQTTFTKIGTATDWSAIAAAGDMFYDPDIGDYVLGGHTLAIKTNKTLWVWGINEWGQLGLGDFTSRTTPTKIGTTSDWSMISASFDDSFALKTNKTMWTWGGNIYGELGVGDTLERNTPSRVGTTSDWSVVVAGGYHTLAIKTNKTIWAWGWNEYYQLGLGDKINRTTPCQVGTTSDWSIIAGGANFSVALKTNGTLWGWGANFAGQLGCGYTLVPDSDVITTIRKTETERWADISWIDNYNETNFRVEERYRIGAGSWGVWWNVAQVNANITSYSKRISFNESYSYQYRIRAYSSYTAPVQVGNDLDWSTIKSGVGHTLAIKNYGTLWAWGTDDDGQLGLGTTLGNGIHERLTPTMVGR